MVSLNAFLSKQVQLQELVACLRHFSVDELRLHLFGKHGQIHPSEAEDVLREAFPSLQLHLTAFDIKDHRTVRSLLSEQADLIAFPLYHSSAFYTAIPRLRRGSTIVHLTDGFGDQFSIWDMQRAVLAKSTWGLLKGGVISALLPLCRADIEFSNFHPRTSPYAKRSRPVGAFPMTKEKRRVLSELFQREKPRVLIIEGFDLSAEKIAVMAGIDGYVATKRSGGIDVNGETYLTEHVICAEEVLELMQPKLVIGCPSTSLIAARLADDDIPVICITTPRAAKMRAKPFNAIFRRHAQPYGVRLTGSDDVDEQFAEIRGWLADAAIEPIRAPDNHDDPSALSVGY